MTYSCARRSIFLKGKLASPCKVWCLNPLNAVVLSVYIMSSACDQSLAYISIAKKITFSLWMLICGIEMIKTANALFCTMAEVTCDQK